MIPGHALSNSDIWRAQQLFDGLYTLGPDAKPVPALAESAEPNADGTVWTIKVRSGVTWHDGKPLTAEDVVASIKTWTGKDNYYAGNLAKLLDTDGVRVRGPLTVEVPFKVPVADFAGVSAFYPYLITRPDIYKKGAQLIGTGPFKYQSFTPGKRAVVVANKDYWGVSGGPYVEQQIVDSSFTDDTARVNALLSGSIDIAPAMPPALAKANASSQRIYLGHAPGTATYYFQCRVDQAPFKDLRVMHALKMLCDREAMIQTVFSGYATQSNDLTGPGLPYFAGADVFPVRKYDPEQAKSLLKQAGQENLSLTLYTSSVSPGLVEGATAYAQQAAKGGVKIKVSRVSPSLYYTAQGPAGGYMSYPFFAEFPGGGSSVPSLTSVYLTNIWTKGGSNETHFGNAQTDKLLLDAIGELDQSKAQEKWNAIQKAQYDGGGSVTYGAAEYVDGYTRRVRGVETNRAGWVNNFNVSKAWITT
ncbi:MAG TPA: ABC transporter substrate-binding protein [Baekduia sp.]|nr:ABC transporter substrate-binding protein [Baekduia sp.]